MENMHQPPSAEPANEHEKTLVKGGMDTALKGEYSISIKDVFSEAWQLTKGNKGTIWGAALLVGAIMFACNYLLGILGLPDGQEQMEAGDWLTGYGLSVLKGFVMAPITVPVMTGFILICIKLTAKVPVDFNEIFAYFRKAPGLVVLSILSTVLLYTGLALFVLPGIYLMIAYAFAMPLMVEKNLSPWQALETSRRAVTHHWFAVFGVCVLLYLMLVASMISIVGVIWGLPMAMLGYSLVYIRIFGIEDGVEHAHLTEK